MISSSAQPSDLDASDTFGQPISKRHGPLGRWHRKQL